MDYQELKDMQSAVKFMRGRFDFSRADGGPGSGNWGHAGRPGQRGGSAEGGGSQNRVSLKSGGYESLSKIWGREKGEFRHDPKIKTAKPPLQNMSTVKTDEAWYSKRSFETLLVYDSEGARKLRLSQGNSVNVMFSDAEARQMKDAVTSHNHPGGSTFSKEDLDTLVRTDQAAMRASTSRGTYQLRRKDGDYPNRSNFANDFDAHHREVLSKTDQIWNQARSDYTSGLLTSYEMDHHIAQQLNNEVNYQMSLWLVRNAGKYGYEYGFDG